VTHVTSSCLALAYTEIMLTKKQFRDRARTELRQIAGQLKGLATDRDVYCRMEDEIVAHNPQLKNHRSAFLDMVRGCYADAMTMRVVRLLEPAEGDPSLERILTQLADYPELLHDRISEQEFADDRAALKQAAANLKNVTLPRAAHHERTTSALASTHRELDAALDLMLSTIKTYYWIANDSYIDVEVKDGEDSMSIFQFAWAMPVVAR
jgi:hypothetical protein